MTSSRDRPAIEPLPPALSSMWRLCKLGYRHEPRYAATVRGAPDARAGRITILVSHRFSTVRMADLIVVLDGSRLVEVGTHDELMARRGQYAELYGIQAAAYR